MPRTKPLTRNEAKDRALRGAIAMGMETEGKSNEEMAAALGMSKPTWARRKREPETFTVGELRKIRAILPGVEFSI